MKLTYIALLGSMLAFTACDNSQDEFGSEVDDPRIETNTSTPNPNQTQSGSASSTSPSATPSPSSTPSSSGSSSQSGQPVNPSNLPPVPPRNENINVTVPPEQPQN